MESFAARVTPAAVRDGFMTFAASNGAFRVTHILSGSHVWDWVQTVGVAWRDELASLLPPVPPVVLRQLTHGPDIVNFLWSGLGHAELMVAKFEKYRDPSLSGIATVLDFGCGCGRLSRYLAMRPDLWTVHSCDVNSLHVSWLREQLPEVRPILSPSAPPVPYDTGQFDLVYALSVFSHLPPNRARSWLTELHRILKPGGVLVVSTHGTTALNRAAESGNHWKLLHLGNRGIETVEMELGDSGYFYSPYSVDDANRVRAGSDYGSSVVSLEGLRRQAGDRLNILEHHEGAVDAWQDVTVMRAQ